MKPALTIALLSLVGLGTAQSTTPAPLLANPLPVGKIVASGNDFAVLDHGKTIPVYFNGTSVTGDALNWETPAKFADRQAEWGINLVRFHHQDNNIDRLLALADACHAKGIYFCFDVVGDRWMNRKVEVYEGGAIRGELITEMDRLKPLLRHPGLAYVALVNEAATPLKGKYNNNWARLTEICNETYDWFKLRLAERGFTGLLGDLPDANIDARFGPIVAKQDIVLVHGYGTHNEGQRWKNENWAKTIVHLGSIINHIYNLARKIEKVVVPPPAPEFNAPELIPAPKPAIVQEFACMFPNPDRAINEMVWRLDLFRRGISVCSYAMATNKGQMRPLGDPLGAYSEVHDFGWITDPARKLSQIGGALLVKHGKGTITDYYYGGAIWPNPPSDPNVRFATAKLTYKQDSLRGIMQIKIGYKKLLYLIIDQTPIRNFTSVPEADGWNRITYRGGLVEGYWKPKPIDCMAPVSGAYQNGATLKKEGNLVHPVSPGIVEVNLK